MRNLVHTYLKDIQTKLKQTYCQRRQEYLRSSEVKILSGSPPPPYPYLSLTACTHPSSHDCAHCAYHQISTQEQSPSFDPSPKYSQ